MSDVNIVLSFSFSADETEIGVKSAETAVKFEVSHDSLSLKEFYLGYVSQMNKQLVDHKLTVGLSEPITADVLHLTITKLPEDVEIDPYECFEKAEDALTKALGEAGYKLNYFHRATAEQFDGTDKFFQFMSNPNGVDKTLN